MKHFMKNIHRFSTIAIALFFFFSCKQEQPLLQLPEETPIVGEDYANEIIMKHAWAMDYRDGKLYLQFSQQSDHVLSIVDAETGQLIKNLGRHGGGPGEFMTASYWGKDDSCLYLYDINQKKLRAYDWQLLDTAKYFPGTDGVDLPVVDGHLGDASMLNQKYFVASVDWGYDKIIAIVDKSLQTVTTLGNFPDKEHETTVLHSYWGRTATYGNKFVFAMAQLGYIVCYEQKADGSFELCWEHYLEKPVYKEDELDIRNLKLAFSEVCMTKNYIFCGYFGEKVRRENLQTLKPRNILVFDHDGNLLKNLHSERSVGTFAISDDEKTLYAITEEPEVAIIRFNIPEILNQ